jgi:hypothetical protein
MVNKYIKMFNIFSHQWNANQNYIEILSYISQNGYHQENENQQILAMIQGNVN